VPDIYAGIGESRAASILRDFFACCVNYLFCRNL
jgi:hypothetical protein